jgi:hypothetical protein
MSAQARLRLRIPFSAVNRREAPGYDPGLQRHHLLPSQLLSRTCFGRFFEVLGPENVDFEDFRHNGLLLPAREKAALRIGLPLHRGPHRSYNAMVAERVGQIESGWSARNGRDPDGALEEAYMRLSLLQSALRRRLLDSGRRPYRLNRFDPLGAGRDFARLDSMADMLWGSTETVMQPFRDED